MAVISEVESEAGRKIKANGQAKNAILQFLTELGIDRIIYVDDRCSIQELKEAFIAKLKEKYDLKPLEIDFIEWNSPKPKFEKSIIDTWESSTDKVKRDLFLKILNYEGNPDDIENSTAPLNLKNHLNDKINLLSPSEWEESKDQIIHELNSDTKILFLFDIEFEHAPLASGRNGIDLAKELLNNQEIKDFVYCGIFSHLFNVDEEYSMRNEYHKTHQFEKSRFYTISKKRFHNDSYLPGLAEGIRNTLLINEVEHLKSESSKVLRKAFKDSLIEIDELNPDSFNHVIQKSSRKEGIWEMATLIRINNVVTKDKALQTLLPKSKRTKINESLTKIRKVEKIKTGGKTPFDKTQIKELRKKELFIENSILNQLHFPISNGDIFSINGKEFILLGQPCNLALRSNGNRDRGYDIGFFIELESIPKEKFQGYSRGQLATLGLIETTDASSNNYKVARFSTFKTVSLLPLDLTVFDPKGRATINLNNLEHDSKTIQDSWKLRYKKLHDEFLEYRNKIITFKKLRSSDKDGLKRLIYYGEMFSNYNINNDDVLNSSRNQITFDIQRITYYREPYSSDLLQQFMQYLSRNAFDRDFLMD
ncbi:hypothetical protein [Ekhidna sp.]|jgi:hypothetical protein|uniref:hypothetical protein n=1 Tax=Ekhidna sp. TaxID=2608089 RepID=UPI0032ECA21F